jgi:hypothetical protein
MERIVFSSIRRDGQVDRPIGMRLEQQLVIARLGLNDLVVPLPRTRGMQVQEGGRRSCRNAAHTRFQHQGKRILQYPGPVYYQK